MKNWFVASLAIVGFALGVQSAKANWDGFYAGVFVGHLTAEGDPQAPSTVATLKTDGWPVGPIAGYDWRVGQIVAGVAGDILFGDLSGSVPDGNFIRFGGETNWVASLRARLGLPLVFDTIMPYVTGGLALADSEASMTCPAGAPFGFCAATGAFRDTQSELLTGYVLGAGLAGLIGTNTSWFVEYRYYDFGEQSISFRTPAGTLPPGKTVFDAQAIGIGVTFQF